MENLTSEKIEGVFVSLLIRYSRSCSSYRYLLDIWLARSFRLRPTLREHEPLIHRFRNYMTATMNMLIHKGFLCLDWYCSHFFQFLHANLCFLNRLHDMVTSIGLKYATHSRVTSLSYHFCISSS